MRILTFFRLVPFSVQIIIFILLTMGTHYYMHNILSRFMGLSALKTVNRNIEISQKFTKNPWKTRIFHVLFLSIYSEFKLYFRSHVFTIKFRPIFFLNLSNSIKFVCVILIVLSKHLAVCQQTVVVVHHI